MILGFAMLAGVVLGAAAVYRRAVAERLIARGLELGGIELGAITVEAFEPTYLAVRDLWIVRPVDLSIRRLVARYSWASLSDERLESVDVRGMRLHAALRERAVSEREPAADEPASIATASAEAALDPPDHTAFLNSLFGFPALPTRRIDLTDFQIELAGSEETYEIDGELHATRTDNQLEAQARIALRGPVELAAGVSLQQSIDFEVELEAKRDEIRATLSPAAVQIQIHGQGPVVIHADTPAITVRVAAAGFDAPARIEVKSTGGRLSAPTYEVEASGFALSTGFAANGLPRRVDLHVASVRDLRRPARIPPVALSASLEIGEGRHSFQLVLRDRSDRVELRVHGHHDTAKDRGVAEFHLKPVSFGEDVQPTDLVRSLSGLISNVTGNVEALGSASLDGVASGGDEQLELRTGVDLALRDVSLTTPLATLVAINSVIHIDGPWPASTPPGQLLQIGLIDFGIAVTNATASFQLHEDFTLDLEEAVLHFAGGTLRTAGLLDLAATEQALTLEVSGVELEALFALVDLEGLSGSGSVSGTIPIVRTNDAIEIRDGELSNQAGDSKLRTAGWIRYRPSAGVEVAAARQSEFGVALEALKNFYYEELDLRLSGNPNGSIEFSLHLAGSNPDFHAGHSVNFNLNLEAPLASLLKTASYTQGLADKIEQNLSTFASRAANFRRAEASTAREDPVAPARSDR